MSRFEAFELPVRKIKDYPLIYEALIPRDCIFFQDVRRYQSTTTHLDVQIIDIDGQITLDQDMQPIPMGKLSASEKKDFIDYLKVRVGRGDNIGSSWAFFRSQENKKNVKAFGANIVYKDAEKGQEQAKQLLAALRSSETKSALLFKFLTAAVILLFLATGGYFFYTKVYLAKTPLLKRYLSQADSREMKFYKALFPQVYSWRMGEDPGKKELAEMLLNPEYIADILTLTSRDYYKEPGTKENNRADRLVLFVYFNYNEMITQAIKDRKKALAGTEFLRLAAIYSCSESGYSSNIFYFKVGDLDIRHSELTDFLVKNKISFRDYTKLRDTKAFSEILEKDAISFKLQSFLQDVYTFSPLRIETPKDGIDWYLLVKKNGSDKLDFAAFFKAGESTLVPKTISSDLLDKSLAAGTYTWYAIGDDQAKALNLSESSLVYFTEKMGQIFKLDVIRKKISELNLTPINGEFSVAVRRELLMEDSQGKYGIQCYDPVTSLVLSNLISKSSFETKNNLTLKRDPIQINTSLIQLSKDDSFSTQAINITPGTTGIVDQFSKVDHFIAELVDGTRVKFEKATQNLFNPYTFMVYSDSITFSFKHDISQMEFALGEKMLKIVKSDDGGHQIIQINE